MALSIGTTSMAFIRCKTVKGIRYYSLVESKRVKGQTHPKQVVLQNLGRYEQALKALERLKVDRKQEYLSALAQKEGRIGAGEIPLPAKVYQCIVIDPPWFYQLRKDDRTHRNRIPYPPMTLDEILDLPIPELSSQQGCVLWLWFTNNHMIEASKCIEHWGYELKTILTWEKVTKAGKPHIGTGHWLRNCTEHCALAVRGKVPAFGSQFAMVCDRPSAIARATPTILHAPKREHSRKPDEFYSLVEQVCPVDKLELFACQKRDGWDCWGNQTDMYQELAK